MSKHLWEVERPYYCEVPDTSENRFPNVRYRSFSDFMKMNGDSDFDYNFLVRWDWEEGEEGKESGMSVYGDKFNGDINYRNGVLKLFYILQRKGEFRCDLIDVCRADEADIIKFLKPRLLYSQFMRIGVLDT